LKLDSEKYLVKNVFSVFTRCTPLNWGTLGYKNLKIKDNGQVLEIKNVIFFNNGIRSKKSFSL